MKHYTSIEQSKKLLKLRMSPEGADMYWKYNHNIHTYDDIPRIVVTKNWDDNYNKNIPCWSLGALLEVIPFHTQTTTSYKNARVDIIYKKEIENSLHTETAKTLLEALIQTICWLLENGYIKKEK